MNRGRSLSNCSSRSTSPLRRASKVGVERRESDGRRTTAKQITFLRASLARLGLPEKVEDEQSTELTDKFLNGDLEDTLRRCYPACHGKTKAKAA